MPILRTYITPHPPLIIPKIGKGKESKIQKTIDAYDQVGRDIAALEPETIVVISPHSVTYADYIHISMGDSARGDFSQFGAKSVSIEKEYDNTFVNELSDAAEIVHIHAGTLGERDKALDHGVLVPLYFVDRYYKDYKIVRVSISGLDALTHYRFGQCISKVAETLGRKTIVIASGDLSHKLKEDGPYGFAEEGPDFDKQVTEAMSTGDFMRFLTFDEEFSNAAAECGLRSFIMMAGALDGLSIKPSFLSYEGTFGVGYAVCLYTITGEDKNRNFGDRFDNEKQVRLSVIAQNEDEFVRLARLSCETYVKEHLPLKRPNGLSDELVHKKAGVFVSLKKDGRLRGCIGTISPTQSCIADEIINNSVSAGLNDPRFDPVTEEELPSIVYSVDVLDKPESITSNAELDVKRYGVIVTHGSKRGLLLPNLESIKSPEEQVKIALQKAGISAHDLYTMERFEVIRHK
jgi:AmmeMemoRadiSam system protein A/AmmeMemoRadiSam system protein B